jgi:hypothetical protein
MDALTADGQSGFRRPGEHGVAISSDYSRPVQVNGFTCRNCTDVDLAKKHIDPAHPQSGPFDMNAAHDPSRKPDAAVKFGGVFAASPQGLAAAAPGDGAAKGGPNPAAARRDRLPPDRPGQRIDLRV